MLVGNQCHAAARKCSSSLISEIQICCIGNERFQVELSMMLKRLVIDQPALLSGDLGPVLHCRAFVLLPVCMGT